MSAELALDFLLPGDPQTRTGGYIYDHRIMQGLAALGWRVTVHSLDSSFPSPSLFALEDARSTLEKIPIGGIVVIDGLALGGMPDLLADQAGRLRLVALIHHPLACEKGLAPERRRALEHSEERALAAVDKVIVTSGWTMERLAGDGVPAERVHVVMPGTDPAPLAHGSGGSSLNLLCVATLTPRKGHAVLFDALSQLRDWSWHLYCVGSLQRDITTATELRAQIERLGLTGRVTLTGEVTEDALANHYASADLFVLASYLEGYGMALAEALSRGLPLVSTSAGAIPDTVTADSAILVPEGDSGALANALAKTMDDPRVLRALASGARIGRDNLPSWEQASEQFAAALRSLW